MNIAYRLAEAVESWLYFEYYCYRAGLFSESSLKSAVGQVLSSIPIEIKGSRVHSDFPHAALNPINKRGRKNEVDFALILDTSDAKMNHAEVAVEAKWAASSHCSPKKIIRDFLRLAAIKLSDPDSKCIFILAGPTRNISEIISKTPFKSMSGNVNKGIGTTKSEKRFILTDDRSSEQWLFTEVAKELTVNKIAIPKSFVTKAYGWQAIKKDCDIVGFQALAWEIVSVSGLHS
ncbi:hypothetical protein [Aeromonas caviae]|uniref:hypothetical protein n=1 Tax=Aeromonas caviae TaxID=648 RepID=UPI002B4635EB|nr:hypothetical protein [Aeromonas caviae]